MKRGEEALLKRGGEALLPCLLCRLAQLVALTALLYVPALALAQGVAPVASPRFEIRRFAVEGNTLLPADEVERIVAAFAGRDRDFGDVQRALEALQDAYARRGYDAVRVVIPEQDIRSGTVRLQVTEARIASVKVEGNRFFDTPNVRASLPTLREGTSPNSRQISENVQLVNENPAKQVNVVLQAGEAPATVDATVKVTDDKPQRFSVFLDNTGNSPTGYYRAGVGYYNANVAGRDHILNAQAITSPTQVSDVTIVGLGYRIPIYEWRGAFDFIAGYSNVNAGAVQDLFSVSGAGSIWSARYTQILPRAGAYEHKLALGWDYRTYRNNVVLIGTASSLVPNITVKPLSLTYTGRWSQVGRDLSFFASYAWNLPGGADGGQDAFTAQRPGAAANYTIWRAGAVYAQALPKDYLLRAAFNAQYTRDRLVPGEQFGMGGMDSVRGFHERETTNDLGHRASLEAYTPDFGSRLSAAWRTRALAFLDWARGSDNVPERNPNNGLASVGVGLRMNQGKSLAMRFDLAHVLNGAGTRPEGSTMFQFSVAYSF